MKNKNIFLNITLCIVIAFRPFYAAAQQVPPTLNTPTIITNAPYTVPYYGLKNLVNTGKFNYVRTTIPDVPLQTTPASNNYYRVSTEFIDGLGRPLQSVGKKSHAHGNDIVNVYVYDSMGRETYQYQPFASPTGGTSVYNTGKIKLNDSFQMRAFYQENGRDEQPFSMTLFDNSPLNRITKVMPAGMGGIGSQKGVSYNYLTNTNWAYNNGNAYILTGGFPYWTMDNTAGALPVNQGQYGQGQLHMTIVTDADGKNSIEVKDKQGKIVMTMGNLTLNAWGTTRPTDYAYTIYIYDDLGRVRCILPPEVAKPSGTTGNFTWPAVTQAQMDGLCYSFIYDYRGNLIEKKEPGKDAEYYVYDKRDRVVMFQDGNLRQKQKWQFSAYDAMDRPIWTGFYGNGAEYRTTIQSYIDDGQSYTPTSIFYYLKKYDNMDIYPASVPNCEFLSYINYNWYSDNMPSFDASQFDGMIPANNILAVSSVPSYVTNDLPTRTSLRIIDPETGLTDQWLTTAIYYDSKGRVIQKASNNLVGGIDRSSNIYYFQGQIYKNIESHHNPKAKPVPGTNDGAKTEYRIVNTFERNFGVGGKGNDLIKKYTQKLNDGPEYELSSYEYDHLGRNTLKQWTAGLNLQEYNMGGAINHIACRNYDQDTVFNEELFYYRGFQSKHYNGNIAGVIWRGKDRVKSAYGYSYDNMNRLTHAEFNQYDGHNWNKSAGIDLTASSITYDLNGNIKTMKQMGRPTISIGSSILMDNLTYTYTPNSNQLRNVKDAGIANSTLPDFKDDVTGNSTSVEEYIYDKNGNLITDLNKKVSSIKYNYINKAEKTFVDNKGVISNTYDAAGNRLRKITTDLVTAATDTIDYIGNFVYKNNELQYILNSEGRARPVAAGHDSFPAIPVDSFQTRFVYDYFVKDHLGNVRSTITSKPNAYPYLASHNISVANVEELVFDNITNVRDTKPGSTNPDDMAARLNGAEADKRIGTAIMLRTNPGDHFTINVNAFYDGDYRQQDAQLPGSAMIESLMGTLLTGSTMGTKPLPVEDLPNNQAVIRNIFGNPALPGQLEQLQEQDNDVDAPKAHLVYLWFNSKFELQAANSGSLQVSQASNGNWGTVSIGGGSYNGNGTVVDGGVNSPATGFLVVYIDNQSIGKDVWFDNLSLNMYESEVLEENHYYPFGLTVNTFSNSSTVKNPYKFNGVELEKHFGLETEEDFYRGYDPQLGRFNGIDPKLSYSLSPYCAMSNNPVLYSDPLGDTTIVFGKNGAYIGTINDNLENQIHFMSQDYTGIGGGDMARGADANKVAKAYRKMSVAFMGKNSAKDLEGIAAHANAENFESGFTAAVSASKELRFTLLSDKFRNEKDNNSYNEDGAIDAAFDPEKQKALFGAGHAHLTASTNVLGDKFWNLGTPTQAEFASDGSDHDYKPVLWRNGSKESFLKGQSSLFIATEFGFTVYGSGTKYYQETRSAANRVIPHEQSYFRYKFLKNDK
nr:DUF6443 domain-containing protein [Mucilaginibacter sp. L294]